MISVRRDEGEPISRLVEFSLRKSQNLRRHHREHENQFSGFIVFAPIVESALARHEAPSSVPLRCPPLGQSLEKCTVGDSASGSFDHNIETYGPVVASGRQNHVCIAPEVDGLLLAGSGAKMDRPIQPHCEREE